MAWATLRLRDVGSTRPGAGRFPGHRAMPVRIKALEEARADALEEQAALRAVLAQLDGRVDVIAHHVLRVQRGAATQHGAAVPRGRAAQVHQRGIGVKHTGLVAEERQRRVVECAGSLHGRDRSRAFFARCR